MVTFCTIHSFCLATLKKFAHFDAECVLATGDIYEFFFQQLVRHKEIVDKVEYIKALLLDIAVCKNSMCPLAQFEPNCGEKELFDEDFYCIPKRVFDMCHLDYESIQIIVEQGQMVITNPQYVLSYLGKDMITCLLKQNVDLGLFAKDLVDLLNEQTIEEAV